MTIHRILHQWVNNVNNIFISTWLYLVLDTHEAQQRSRDHAQHAYILVIISLVHVC